MEHNDGDLEQESWPDEAAGKMDERDKGGGEQPSMDLEEVLDVLGFWSNLRPALDLGYCSEFVSSVAVAKLRG